MKQRIISAIVLLVIIVPIVIIGKDLYAFGVGLVSMFAYYEVTKMKTFKDIPDIVKIIGVFTYLSLIVGGYFYNHIDNILINILPVFLFIMLLPSLFINKDRYTSKLAFELIGILLLVTIGFIGLLTAREAGLSIFLYLVSITVLSDTFAYFTGLLIGKNKLLPSVSPKKTIEGSIGGLIAGTVVPMIIYINLIGDFSYITLGITIMLAAASQLGDLIYSKIKRDNDVKDFSNLIPGHGGILDRLDSILIVSMLYLVISMYL